jgi:hypothetical protein
MKPSGRGRTDAIGALEMMEEATCLLRRAPVEVLALYYVGALPFVLGLLYFWADMSRSADAGDRLAGASLGMALLFVWMKYWQARFAGRLSTLVSNAHPACRAADTALAQAIIHPWGFVVMPAALLITLPFGWCFAFFQNVTVIGGGPDVRGVFRTAQRQAALWPGQNHLLICIFLLLGLVVFANLCVSAFFLPRVLKTLLGIESIFTRSNLYLLNSTFLAAMTALTYLCLDPLVKAVYLLRCHYGASLSTGADLLAELRNARRSAGIGLGMFLLAASLLVAAVPPVMAVDARVGTAPGVDPQRLDKTIERVISGPEFAWRLPREARQHRDELPGFLGAAVEMLKDWAVKAGDWLKRVLEWLKEILPKFKPGKEWAKSGTSFPGYVFPLMYGVLAILLSFGGVILWRQVRQRQQTEPDTVTSTPVREPDVGDEDVLADELSEGRWRTLAGELLAKGELRLGLRALYLACLASLGEARLIAIARFKSNRDYERELGRFAHALPGVADAFSRNVALFEQIWYGMHRPDREMIAGFMADYERIVSGVRQK